MTRQERGSYFKDKLDKASQNYAIAVEHYRHLKDVFLQQVNQAQQKTISTMTEEQLLRDINQSFSEIGEIPPTEEEKKLMEDILKALVDQVKGYILKDQNTDELREKIEQLENSKRIHIRDFAHYYDRRRNEIEQFLKERFAAKGVRDELTAIFTKIFQDRNMTYSSSQFAGLQGMLQRALLFEISGKSDNTTFRLKDGQKATDISQVLNNKTMNGFRKNIGGFGHEAAFVRAVEKLDPFQGKVFQTQGNLVDKKESAYDVLISFSEDGIQKLSSGNNEFFADLLSQLEDGTMTSSATGIFTKQEVLDLKKSTAKSTTFGAQIKRGWTLQEKPASKFNGLFYSIGSRSQLLNSLGGGILTNYTEPEYKEKPDGPGYDRGWHNAVFLASTAIFKILGQYQVMFQLKHETIWTYQLLDIMMTYKLWLTFHFSRGQGEFKYPATPEVVFEPARYLYFTKRIKKNNVTK